MAERLPAYNLRWIAEVRHKAGQNKQLLCLLMSVIEPQDVAPLASVYRKLVDKQVPEHLYRDSLSQYVGWEMNRNLIELLAWRLAANRATLRDGQPVYPWTGQTRPEWVPLQIRDVSWTISARNGRPTNAVKLRVLAGTSCGMTLHRHWSPQFCTYLARKFLGFANRRHQPHCQYEHSSQLTGLMLYGLMTPEFSSSKAPGFQQVRVPESLRQSNRKLLLRRDRVDFQCPEQFQHPCHGCPIGYDRCPCGTHSRSYAKLYCSGCKQVTWFDPANQGSGLCITCSRKSKIRAAKEQQ